MAWTNLGDVFARDREAAYEVVQSYMDTDPVTTTPFFESGLVVSNPIIQEIAASNTGIVELPFWLKIDSSVEPNYSNDVYTDVAVPRSIGTGHMRARNAYLNEGFGSMDLVSEITGRDPLQRVASRLDLFWREQAERRIVATLRGIYNEAVAEDLDMVHEAEAITYEGLIDAQFTMGDAFGSIGGYVMNSAAFKALVKEDITEVRRNRETNVVERTVNGLPVIVNDAAMTDGDGNPIVALIGPGALAYGMALPRTPLEYEREAARGNGGGAETLWTRRNMIVHPLGFDFTSEVITGNGASDNGPRSAGWSDLADADNWDLVADRKQVPIAFLAIAEETGEG